jgi:hypothetical protein
VQKEILGNKEFDIINARCNNEDHSFSVDPVSLSSSWAAYVSYSMGLIL